MIRNCLSAAWGDLVRSPVQSFIAIGGLAIGLAAAILAGIVAGNQASYDDFVPGYQNLYVAIVESHGGNGDTYLDITPHDIAALLLLKVPGIQTATRLQEGWKMAVQKGAIMAEESISFVDQNFFTVMPLPILYGDLDKTLSQPDRIVIPLTVARKYFGRDNVVGETLKLDHTHLLTVGAVIADLPLNATNLASSIFVSSAASFSPLAKAVPSLVKGGNYLLDVETLVRLRPGASLAALDRDASALMDSFRSPGDPDPTNRRGMHFERLDALHLSARVHPDTRSRLLVLVTSALSILVLACMNFVNLSTARAGQRRTEVAVRKVAGARQRTLVAQFLGESILQVLLALGVAVALVEWSLPAVNGFLDSGASFDYWRDPGLIVLLILGAVLVGIAAGFYPAIILSGFRPVSTLKGAMGGSTTGDWIRQILVALQFAALITLLIAAVTVFRQNRFATTEALRADTDQVLLVSMKGCDEGFRSRVAALPGVRAVVCTDLAALPTRMTQSSGVVPHDPNAPGLQQGHATLSFESVGFGFFEMYGIRPVAGRLFRRESGDQIPPDPPADQKVHYVLNQTAARQLGFASPQAAVGQTMTMVKPSQPHPRSRHLDGAIVGVVPDFVLTPITGGLFQGVGDHAIPPMAYTVGTAHTGTSDSTTILHVKLIGHDVPQTLAAIDKAWGESGEQDPIDRFFLDAFVQKLEIAVLRQGEAFAVFSGVAMLLACLGLFGVALFTASRRTKEIGIRKVMGARDGQIAALLLWQFAKPVLWANVIAWPVAFWAMNSWLSGFAYRVSLPLWLFPAAGGVALLIALAAVAGQAILVARQRPVLALRYE